MLLTGVKPGVAEYQVLTARVRNDLVMWEESRIARHNAEVQRQTKKPGLSLRDGD